MKKPLLVILVAFVLGALCVIGLILVGWERVLDSIR